MFVGINLDIAGMDSKKAVIRIIMEYGISKVQENLYESYKFPSNRIGTLKKEIAQCLDMDDRIRLYQYPIDNNFAISYLENRKWKRLSISQ